MTPHEVTHLPYRPCAGVVLTNHAGQVFAGQRAEMTTAAWQMPQGGVDEGETPEEAAFRELKEETGVKRKHVTLLGHTADWIPYDFPTEVAGKRWGGKFRGQKQMWYHLRLDAPDDVIDLAYKDVEFSDWRWMDPAELLEVIVEFKRPVYRQVMEELGLI